MSKQAKAGWFPDPHAAGGERYWDGEQWTDQRRAAAQPDLPVHVETPKRHGWSSTSYALASVAFYIGSGIVFNLESLTADDQVTFSALLAALGTGFALVAIIATGVRLGLREHEDDLTP